MKLTISMASHRGKVRQKNEDNLYVDGLVLSQRNNGLKPQSITVSTEQPRLLGVFDGMGGYSAGERASYLAAEAVNEFAGACLDTMPGAELMQRVCQLANERVCAEMLQGDRDRIGTTASMLHLHADRYTVCNVGDSPVFLHRGGVMYLISKEHTEKANYERITGKKAPPTKKFRLTQNIGIFADEMLIEPYCASDTIQSGDSFLICSDGLTDMVSAETIAEVLNRSVPAQQKVDILLQMALDNGGKDNITIVLISTNAESGLAHRKIWLPLLCGVALLIMVAVISFCLGRGRADRTLPTQTSSTSEETTDQTQASGETTEGDATGTTEAGNMVVHEEDPSESTGAEETKAAEANDVVTNETEASENTEAETTTET